MEYYIAVKINSGIKQYGKIIRNHVVQKIQITEDIYNHYYFYKT